ncbi:diguanylate cyclase (GGDEF)-like protein [Roseibium hamelinense]|uniref:Diguanylate cyclase (GGDEF)-like protein n=1 Tax=Roseibium hamelinense TaxID=150831 RepID=A0A562SUF5_9HYPH|nr:EAL domain-containing protein [Roseibium hamelinense]MTI42545.1 EAL domain-containing protein [Roseibium hamelinense]TWI84813.1 diguanylate cyclase (GGDEF)-like protein [Roseibium hamelinense]
MADQLQPEFEAARLASLQSTDILEVDRDAELDCIAQILADIFDCPLAFVTIIDQDTQWLKGRFGLDVVCTSRDDSICNHALGSTEPLVINDTLEDPRVAENPYVTGAPFIRFYAGCPITLDGKHPIGTLCVEGPEPKQPTRAQLRQLRRLGSVVERLIKAFTVEHDSLSEAEQTRNELISARDENALMQHIEKISGIGVFTVNWATGETKWSDQVFKIHDLPVGKTPLLQEALQFFPEEERERIIPQMQRELADKGSTFIEADFVTALKRERRVRFTGELQTKTEADSDPMVIGVMQDITDQYQNERALWRAANIDPLSDLANRSWFNRRLTAELDRAGESHKNLALYLVDLDGFKLVNDSLGHQVGDDVIRIMSKRLKEKAGHNAFCARLAGDEFAIIRMFDSLGITLNEEIRALGDELVECLKEPLALAGESLYLGGSVGIARFPQDSERPDGLLKCADMALYKAKRSGRGMAMFYVDELKYIFGARRAAIDIVRASHSSKNIEAHYQPIVDMQTMEPIGAEALVRIRTADGSLLGPEDFWAAFDDPESARSIDQSVSDRVLVDMADWRSGGATPGIVSMNVSDYWFQTNDFADHTLRSLEEAKIVPSSMRLEVSETVLQNDDGQGIVRELRKLSEAGMSIALDDFGAGFASLTQLRDYPVDAIKIHRSFIRNLMTDQQHMLIVKALIDLANSLEIGVIATGVQARREADFLMQLGCHLGQGSLFGDAVPAKQLIAKADQLAFRAKAS